MNEVNSVSYSLRNQIDAPSKAKIEKIGIVAGSGDLVKELLNACSALSLKCYVANISEENEFSVSEQQFSSETASFLDTYPSVQCAKRFYIGHISSIITYFNENDVQNIVFAGKVQRIELRDIKVDILGAKLLAKILSKKILGDDSVLKVISQFCASLGFNVLSAQDLLMQQRALRPMASSLNTKATEGINLNILTQSDLESISLGAKIIESISDFDVGQSVVVENAYVLGIEAAEGTDALIKRCASLAKSRSVASSGAIDTNMILIKMPKTNQDRKMDLPVIGITTIENLIKYNYKGIAVSSSDLIILNQDEVFKLIRENGLFLFFVAKMLCE